MFVSLTPNLSASDAEMSEDSLGGFSDTFTITDDLDSETTLDSMDALKNFASARALDKYHFNHPIGDLDCVVIDVIAEVK